MPVSLSRPGDSEEALALAKVRRIKRFIVRLALYGVTVGTLTTVNLLTTPHQLWVQWPALVWASSFSCTG